MDDGRVHVQVEEIWRRVRRWAKRRGYVYDPSYGVVDVAAT
jgi:hypothetical protein